MNVDYFLERLRKNLENETNLVSSGTDYSDSNIIYKEQLINKNKLNLIIPKSLLIDNLNKELISRHECFYSDKGIKDNKDLLKTGNTKDIEKRMRPFRTSANFNTPQVWNYHSDKVNEDFIQRYIKFSGKGKLLGENKSTEVFEYSEDIKNFLKDLNVPELYVRVLVSCENGDCDYFTKAIKYKGNKKRAEQLRRACIYTFGGNSIDELLKEISKTIKNQCLLINIRRAFLFI